VPAFSAVAGAAERYYRDNRALRNKFKALLKEIKTEFGWSSGLIASLGGRYVLGKIRREERRLARGWTYEPPTFYEGNDAVAPENSAGISRCAYITPRIKSAPVDEDACVLEEVARL
jgi:hypothetical protein